MIDAAEILKRLDAIRCWLPTPGDARKDDAVATARAELDSLIADLSPVDPENPPPDDDPLHGEGR